MPLTKPAGLTQWEWMVQRFWAGVEVKGPDDCWNWRRAKVTDGYGTISLCKGTPFATHRLSYRINNGPIPAGMQVMHTCDNPPCCNPKHLILGTNLYNIKDMINKKRGAVVLSKEQVEKIKLDKRTQRLVAGDYGITQSMVSLIKSGKRWHNWG